MIRSLLLSVIFTGSLSVAQLAVAQAAVATDPVGFITINIDGTQGVAESALTFVGLSMTQPIGFQGTVNTYNGATKTLSSNGGAFTEDQFNGVNGPHFVEIASGPHAGFQSDIADTTSSPSAIVTVDDLSSKLTGGESIKIRKHWTLQSVFGPNADTNNQVVLQTGGSSTADQVLLYDQATQQYITYYYKVGGITGGNGWRSTSGQTPLSTDRSNQILRNTDGAIVKRRASTDVALSLPGAVKLGPTQRVIQPGLNISGNVYAGGTTLGNSGLYNPNNPSASLQGGGSSTADQVLIYDGTQYITYYYKVGGISGGNGWRSTSGSSPLSTDVSNTPLPAGGSIIVKRQAQQAFTWTAQQPFTLTP